MWKSIRGVIIDNNKTQVHPIHMGISLYRQHRIALIDLYLAVIDSKTGYWIRADPDMYLLDPNHTGIVHLPSEPIRHYIDRNNKHYVYMVVNDEWLVL